MDLGLRDRVYLVTGGSRGLGFAAAQALVTDGARVVLSAPHQATAAAAATRLTQHGAAADTAAWVVADNADPATPGRLIAAAKDRFGRLDGALISVGGTPAGTAAPVRPVSSCAAARPAAVWRSGQREPQTAGPTPGSTRRSTTCSTGNPSPCLRRGPWCRWRSEPCWRRNCTRRSPRATHCSASAIAIARCERCDEVVFSVETDPARFVSVHLTWRRAPERLPWPWTEDLSLPLSSSLTEHEH